MPERIPASASDRRQLQQIIRGLYEGVILINPDQSIEWANRAALDMHGVDDLRHLGRTVDEYRARFRLRYRNNHPVTQGHTPIERVVQGESFRDVVVEVTPPGRHDAAWVHKVRSLVLTHESGEPDCLVLIIRDMTARFEAEERFESSFNVNPAPATICRLRDGQYLKVNRGFLDLTGHRSAAILGRSLEDGDAFGAVLDWKSARDRLLRGEPLTQTEVSLESADGHRRPVIVAGQPIVFADEGCVMLTFVDLEPRRSAERRLAEHQAKSQADFEALYAETPVPMHSLDNERRVISVSDRWLELLEYRRDEVIGRPITDFLADREAASAFRQDWDHLLEARVVRDLEHRFLTRSGMPLDVLVSGRVVFDAVGAPIRTVAALSDLSERRDSEERFTRVFEMAPVPMLVLATEDHRILNANNAFLDCIRQPAEVVIGRVMTELEFWSTDGAAERVEESLVKGEKLRDRPIRGLAATGEVLECLLSIDIVSLLGQRRALVVIQDITDRQRSETQLFEAIEAVMRDTSWFSRTVIERLNQLRHPTGEGNRSSVGDLTPRELEILSLVSAGSSDAAIAERLALSRSTIRNHLGTIYGKIDVHKRSSAIVWAREHGVIGPAETSARTARRRRE